MIFTVTPLIPAFLHFLLFAFYPRSRENLYYALFLACLATVAFIDHEFQLVPEAQHLFFVHVILRTAIVLMAISGLRFGYAVFYDKLPKQFWLFPGLGVIAGLVAFFNPLAAGSLTYFIGLIALIETLRLIVAAILKKKDGAWIIGIGVLLFIPAAAYDLLLDLQFLSPIGEIQNSYSIGVIAFIASMSVYLARNYARTHVQILENERRERQQEIESKLLEADNARKTKELEEARQLQLAMLPKSVPSAPHLRIVPYMKSATEVGGDYYDFHNNDSNQEPEAARLNSGYAADFVLSIRQRLCGRDRDQGDAVGRILELPLSTSRARIDPGGHGYADVGWIRGDV